MAPPRPTKKRRTDVAPTNAPALAGPIGNIRALQSAMADYSGAGLKAVKDFLFRCSKGPEVEELEAAANRSILKQYLETQTKEAQKESDDAEKESSAFAEVVQIWSYANQNNSINLLSLVPATMANLVRICSYHEEEFKNYGTILIKSLLQPTTLKIIYRGLTGNKDKVVSPCLRLLTEMNRFNFGAMCGFVHSTIDFTIKDLPRNLEVKGGAKATVEEIGRPSVRTQFLRFFLSFLQNGEPSVRNEMMGLRSWITPIFKHLKTDTPEIINDLLTCFTTRVLDEKEIPRATKTNAFNEWILAHILELYTREETVKTSNAGKDIEKPLADIAHEFLMSVCTKRGSGACFPDHGWYPPGHMADEEKRKSAPKVFNRILSSLLTHIRPYASTMQLDLMLDILKTCPELVADYFLSNWSFSFDPKLTSTWIGYCTFLHSTITLPIPENFGAPEAQILPPPTNVIVENVLPKPLTKAIMSKCLTHENNFIRFLATRLLISAFQKLRSVLKALDEAAGSVHDPTETWKRCRFDVIEEFCKRIPDASVVSNIAGKTSGVLQTEARMRLLAEYYTTIPELALSGNYDVNVALSNFLGNEFEDQKGMKQLEMGHLLQIATEVPDVKWWNKTPAMKHSPFVAILKRCCSTATNTSQRQVRTLLHSFASTSYLFQAETSASPLDALLESLSTLEDSGDLEAILSLLDEVVARCIRGPFKYLDDYAELAAEIQKQKPEASNFAPVSPLVMTLVEQWKFFMQSKDHSSQQKLGGVRWLLRLLESCAVLGENRFVLAVLCDRVASSGSTDESIPKLKNYLQEGDQGLEIAPNGGREYDSAVGVRDMFTRFPNRRIDVQMIALLSDGVLHRRIEPSLFDLAVVQRAITEVAESRNISTSKAAAVITQLNELMKYVAFQLMGQGEKVAGTTKTLVTKEGACIPLFLNTSVPAERLSAVVALSHGYAELLSTVSEQSDSALESVREIFTSSLPGFLSKFAALSEEDLSKVLFIYRTIITLLYSPEDVSNLAERLSSESSLIRDETVSQLFAFILHRSAERGDIIGANVIHRLLKAKTMSSRVSSALVAYISAVDAEELQGISYYKAATPEHTAVVCAMIPKVEVVRNKSLAQLEKNLQAGNTVQMLSECFSALLQAYSVAGEGDAAYTWAESADEEVKTKLQRIFEATQKELLESALDLTQVNVLLRAASLFPSLDREQVLKHIATDRKRSALTENTVALVGALLQDSNDAAKPEMKRWFLMVFDYLTRRFAEDAVLTGKVAAFAKALGGLIARKEIKLENIIPKSTLNAVLEAGLEKHINVPEVVYLAVNLVSLSSQKSLNLAKLLQMVLGHTDNPLAQRDTIYEAEDIHHHVAFLISKLFLAGKTSLCNIGTMNGVMALYRGTNGHIDGLLLMIITYIEGHLARSCAASVASWSVSESTEKPLISNVRGRLEVVVNAKLLAKSVFHLTPVTSSAEIESLDSYLAGVKDNTTPLGKAYDPRFMLPAITFCLVSTAHIIDAQAAIERNCVAYAMACLSSEDANIREMATRFLSSVVSKLEESPYRNKTQISHLILGLLASFSSQEEETKNQPLPSAMGIFLAQASQVLANPTHFLYEKVMELLLRGPLLQLHDLPLMLSTLQVGEEHHKEVAWILNILTAGLKTEKDLVLYRKRNVFGNVLNLYISPNSTDHAKERVLGLLWNAAAIEGGGTTLITRNGAIAWIEQMLGVSTGEDLMLKRLAARLWEGSAKTHVKEWSRGSLSAHFVGDGARLGAQMEVDVET